MTLTIGGLAGSGKAGQYAGDPRGRRETSALPHMIRWAKHTEPSIQVRQGTRR